MQNKSFLALAGLALFALLGAASHAEGGRVLGEAAKKRKEEEAKEKTDMVYFVESFTFAETDAKAVKAMERLDVLLREGKGDDVVLACKQEDGEHRVKVAVKDYYKTAVAREIHGLVKQLKETSAAHAEAKV